MASSCGDWADTGEGAGGDPDAPLNRMHDWYQKIPGLRQLRHSPLLREIGTRAIQELKKRTGNPYPDIVSPDTPGWRLMEAIVRQFAAEVRPRPLVVVPIPTPEFYQDGREPIYQKLFQRLDAPSEGVHVCLASSITRSSIVRCASLLAGASRRTPSAADRASGWRHCPCTA